MKSERTDLPILLAMIEGKPVTDKQRRQLLASHLEDPRRSARHLATACKTLVCPPDEKAFWATAGLDSFDPGLFFLNLHRLVETEDGRALVSELPATPEAANRLTALLSGSPFLTEACLTRPEFLRKVLAPEFLNLSNTLFDSDQLPSGENEENFISHLAEFKLAETLRIVLADLTDAWKPEEVLARISDLASACIQCSLSFAWAELEKKHGSPVNSDPEMEGKPADFTVLGMGKLGGRELNFSSDIDLIYLHRTELGETTGGTGPAVTNTQFFTKLAQRITHLLGAVTGEGPLYRVDLRLRPGGQSGDASIALAGAETYYEYWGEMWERQALIRCRSVAGSEELADEFLGRVAPFLWRRTLDYRDIETLRLNKRRIEQSIPARQGGTMDVKLSRGGIREVEFIVQAFQLIYGGKEIDLRGKTTLRILETLFEKGMMPGTDTKDLAEAYLFLRRLENRIQLLENRQTHMIPTDQLAALARKMGLGQGSRLASEAALMDTYNHHRQRVMAAFDQMFPEPGDKSIQSGHEKKDATPGLDKGSDGKNRLITRLAGHGFRDPEQAWKNLSTLREGAGTGLATASSKQLFSLILSDLIQTAGRLPDPDLAIGNLEKFVRAMGSREALFSTLADSPDWTHSLLTLLGSSDYLSAILISQPDFLESTFRPEYLNRAKKATDLETDISAQLAEISDDNRRHLELRRIKRAEEVRIGLRYLLGWTDIEKVMEELTQLADAVCAASLKQARLELEQSDLSQGNKPVPFTIFGLGSLGARELVFNSDLDLLFLYEEAQNDDSGKRRMAAIRMSERLNRILSANLENGFTYRVDLRLRPEGSHGPLTASATAFSKYLEARASWWERQSLLRMRYLAGDKSLADRVLNGADKHLHGVSFSGKARSELAMLRDRMGTERGKKGARYIDLKCGKGGLVDAEFIAQWLMLARMEHSPVSITETHGNTKDLLSHLAAEGALDENDAEALTCGHLFLKQLQNQIRLTFERPLSYLDAEGERLDLIARLLGIQTSPEGPALLKELRDRLEEMRGIYDRLASEFMPVS